MGWRQAGLLVGILMEKVDIQVFLRWGGAAGGWLVQAQHGGLMQTQYSGGLAGAGSARWPLFCSLWPPAILSGQLCSGKYPRKGRTLKTPHLLGQCRLMFCLHRCYLSFLLKGSFPSELKLILNSTHRFLCGCFWCWVHSQGRCD